MTETVISLGEAIDRACGLLTANGNDATPPRMLELAKRLRSGDNSAIVTAFSEATGGMGSLNDQSLYPAAAADGQFRTVVKDIEKLARLAAAEQGIMLVR